MSDLARLLRAATAQATKSLNTCIPGQIVGYDAGQQRASVKPLLRQKQPDGREENMPVINDVPVIFSRGGGGGLTFPIKEGDGCLLVFSQRSMDEFKENGKEVIPSDNRNFDLSDAVAIPGTFGFHVSAADDAVELFFGDTKIRLEGDTIRMTGNVVINGDVTIEGDLHVEEDVLVDGDIDYHGESDDLTP